MQSGAEKPVIYEKKGNIARIIFNRPEKLNAMDFPGMGGIVDGLHAALRQAEEDDDIKVVIIKGNGRAFCAGHDLSTVGFVYGMGTGKPGERRASERARLKVDQSQHEWRRHLFLFPKVTIAQVHGHCIGEGIMLAELCDLMIVAEDAQIGHTEQRLGFAGSGICTLEVEIATIGMKKSMDLLLTGRFIDGREADRIGLASRVFPADRLDEETFKIAETVARMPRDGIAIGKAQRHLAYEAMGITHGFAEYIGHTLFTNLRWETDEYNFFKQRRDAGTKSAFHDRDQFYVKKEGGS